MKANKEKFECQECGKVFLKVIPKSLEVKCPKCGSYDVDLKTIITISWSRPLKGIPFIENGELKFS